MNRPAGASETVPRLVIVPAWGTPDGPWTRIRDTWPGAVITFWGAGLRSEAVAGNWSLASDVNDLAEMIDEHDVVCGAGWAASTVLLATRAQRPRAVADEAELRAWCKERLAGYKCPTSVEFRDELARTATGKLQKFKLRAPYWEGHERQVN